MTIIAVLIGAILIVAAIRGTQGALFSALAIDVPGYVVWAAAIVALGAIGWIPDLKPISRGLLALVIIVIILRNYQQVIAGFQAAIVPSAVANTASSGPAASTSAIVTAGNSTTIAGNLNADALPASGGDAVTATPSPFGGIESNYSFGGTLDASNFGTGLSLTGSGQ